jgi:hypothetical protein
MKKEDLFGGGYKVIIKGKEYHEPVVFLPDEPTNLQCFLNAISEKHEPPINKTGLIAAMRLKGVNIPRFQVDVGVQMLINLKLVKDIGKNFFGYTLIANYENAKVKNGVVYFD